MKWYMQAPSNIALIKYMGKQDHPGNHAENVSFSYTLPHLLSFVSVSPYAGREDRWVPLSQTTQPLSCHAQERFLQHFKRIKAHFGYHGVFEIASENNFPLSVGIASSASSFAALTRCATSALSMIMHEPLLTVKEQSSLSRLGSGSSCRSFYSPWCIWEGERVTAMHTPYPTLIHQVVVCSKQEKSVSSSEAHQRVKSSPHYRGRVNRTLARLDLLLSAMEQQAWGRMYQLCFDEWVDLHRLFESSSIPFTYLTPHCKQALEICKQYWQQFHDGPLITMDAGSSIHLLYRPDQEKIAKHFKERLLSTYEII